MNTPIYQQKFGDATITIFNAGHVQFDLANSLDADKSAWSPRYDDQFAKPVVSPIQCIHISLPTTNVLVDAGLYDFSPDSPFAMPIGYTPPQHLCDQMAAANISPNAVDHVIITHLHRDHFNGLSVEQDGRVVPSFPNATCYIGRADWERAITQEALTDPASLESQTLGVLNQQGKLVLVDGEQTITAGISVFPTPGETPAHQAVQINIGDKIFYCVGDLYHHPVEVAHSDWSVKWSDGKANRASRDRFSRVALKEDAWLIATHIDGVGRLAQTADGVNWVAIEE